MTNDEFSALFTLCEKLFKEKQAAAGELPLSYVYAYLENQKVGVIYAHDLPKLLQSVLQGKAGGNN